MEVYTKKYKRKNSLRLNGYDYSWEGMYFITVRVKSSGTLLSRVNNEEVELSSLGKIVKDEWIKTEDIRTGITLGNFVIMPDHFHALVLLHSGTVGAHSYAPLQAGNFKNSFGPQKRNLSSLIRGFKGACTKRIREIEPGFTWQRSFHDRIVRDQNELEKIEDYIINNPLNETLRNQHPIEIFY